MVFSSAIFLFAFVPLFFIPLFCMRDKIRLQNAWIVGGSLLFYAWGAREFIVIVLGTLVIDYILGRLIYTRPKYPTFFVCIDVIMNVGILLYFKYLNFFIENINVIFANVGLNPVVYTKIILPLGVSFIIFQKMTYCLDIARGEAKPAENFFYLMEYLLIFPQIIAGPIVKYNEINSQIKERVIDRNSFLYGFRRFSVGLFKKVWIADIIAGVANVVFSAQAVGSVPFDYAWIGAVAYTFQIYFDFSGYSDMAIGMLAMMGFHIKENFNMPYIATSITEFWKRWHISMTSWFREYLYFPLGGNRNGLLRSYFNKWVVFLVSGFWHGAAWNFIFWGVYHGALMCLETIVSPPRRQTQCGKVPNFIKLIGTFYLVMTGWIFFRADTIERGFSYVVNMYDFNSYYLKIAPQFILDISPLEYSALVLAAIISFFPFFVKPYSWLKAKIAIHPDLPYVGVLILFALSSLKVISGTESPFIYFKF